VLREIKQVRFAEAVLHVSNEAYRPNFVHDVLATLALKLIYSTAHHTYATTPLASCSFFSSTPLGAPFATFPL
jgi:hypothetical protein